MSVEAKRGRLVGTEGQLKSAFLCGSPASYGLIPDAMPVAARCLLVAANGYSAGGGVSIPLYTAGNGGITELMDEVFPMLEQTKMQKEVLRGTFGDCRVQKEHPLSRYCAALAEAEAVHFLQDTQGSFEELRDGLGDRLTDSLRRLRARMEEGDAAHTTVGRHRSFPQVSEEYYEVSFGACRIMQEEDGSYTADIFSAGDMRVFLMDGEGLFPLWVSRTTRLSANGGTAMDGGRIHLSHPEPFAVVLLSATICPQFDDRETTRVTVQARMRLEERLLRIVNTAAEEQELGARAVQVLSDLAVGQKSVSGAMTIHSDGGYAAFREVCRLRLQTLEQDMALLPSGYSPLKEPPRDSCIETERSFVRETFLAHPELREQVRLHIDGRVREMMAALPRDAEGGLLPAEKTALSEPICPKGSNDPLRRLTTEDVRRALEVYEDANLADRAHMRQCRKLLYTLLSEHWTVLRPLLCAEGETGNPAAERQYRSCLELNRRLEVALSARRSRLDALKAQLARDVSLLENRAEDWVMGRADPSGCCDLLDRYATVLPARIGGIAEHWETDTDHFNALRAAYTSERAVLFDLDIAPDGFFAETYVALTTGECSEETQRRLREAVSAEPKGTLSGILDTVLVLSSAIRRLRGQIGSRESEWKCVHELSESFEWQFACVRCAVYGDETENSAAALLDDPTRFAYNRVVREWREETALRECRMNTFKTYTRNYKQYLSDTVRQGTE